MGERESRFLTAHQHKNRQFGAIRGKNRSKSSSASLTLFDAGMKRDKTICSYSKNSEDKKEEKRIN